MSKPGFNETPADQDLLRGSVRNLLLAMDRMCDMLAAGSEQSRRLINDRKQNGHRDGHPKKS